MSCSWLNCGSTKAHLPPSELVSLSLEGVMRPRILLLVIPVATTSSSAEAIPIKLKILSIDAMK